jgi:hypothetical protein
MYADIAAVAPRASWGGFFRHPILSSVENQFFHIFQTERNLSSFLFGKGWNPVETRGHARNPWTDETWETRGKPGDRIERIPDKFL